MWGLFRDEDSNSRFHAPPEAKRDRDQESRIVRLRPGGRKASGLVAKPLCPPVGVHGGRSGVRTCKLAQTPVRSRTGPLSPPRTQKFAFQ